MGAIAGVGGIFVALKKNRENSYLAFGGFDLRVIAGVALREGFPNNDFSFLF